jgi:hypothetical protein
MPSDYERGFDRRATTDEARLPPDKRPWTEYDKDGHKQVTLPTLHWIAHAATPSASHVCSFPALHVPVSRRLMARHKRLRRECS